MQDNADSKSIYSCLENEILPLYYSKDSKGFNKEWVKMMKASIKSVGGNYNTSRMLCDYLRKLYVPQMQLTTTTYSDPKAVEEFYNWKNSIINEWSKVSISSSAINDEVSIKAGDELNLTCTVSLGNIAPTSVACEVFYGKFTNGEKLIGSSYKEMELSKDLGNGQYEYKTSIDIDNGGNYGYTFRIVPKNEMLINKQDMSLVRWIES